VWCRRVGGDMGHTQLKTGVQGGHVEHRGETEVKVMDKKEDKKAGGKKYFLVPRPPTKIDRPALPRGL
jgi:hypothetical protein